MTEVNRKEMLAGLFLSKFDKVGLQELGFTTWNEAYNALALAVHGRPLSVKGYRDEFDPFFDNPRKGWHKRPAHQNRLEMMDEYCDLSLEAFAELVRTQFAVDGHDLDAEIGSMAKSKGQILLTEKEFKMADYLKKRFYLYVVSGFSSNAPRPIIVDDPLSAGIAFEEKTIESTQKVWVAKVVAA